MTLEITELDRQKYLMTGASKGYEEAVVQLLTDMGFSKIEIAGYNYNRKPHPHDADTALIEHENDLPAPGVAAFLRDIRIGYTHPYPRGNQRVSIYETGEEKRNRSPRTLEGAGTDFEEAYRGVLEEAFEPALVIHRNPTTPEEQQIAPIRVLLVVGDKRKQSRPRALFRFNSAATAPAITG